MSQILKQSVGIDLSKDKFDACFSVIDHQQKVTVKATRKFSNSKAGFNAFDEWLSKKANHKPECGSVALVFVLEATGVYYEQLAWHLFEQQAQLSVVLPSQAKHYFKSVGLKSKNDKIDAKGLARMGAEQALDGWQPLSADFYTLRTLTRETERLHQAKTVLNNQAHALQHAHIQSKSSLKRIEQHIKLIDKQLLVIEREIIEVVSQNPELKQKIDHIMQVKGLGLMSIVTVLSECNGFALINNQKQLVSYAGYDIVERQSGTYQGKTRISKKGNSHIRRILHMPAFNVVKYEPGFTAFYNRLIANGKTKMQAYVAVQKKLLVLIYTLWEKNEPFKSEPAVQAPTVTTPSSNEELKLLLPAAAVAGVFRENRKGRTDSKKVALTNRATQDELSCNESLEALLPVEQS